jgi:cytochrome c oxidase subunit 2
MTSLLVIIVLVLLAVALWQLTKIFDLTQVGSTDSSQVATDNDNNVQGYLMFGFFGLYIYIYNLWFVHGDLVLHTPASAHGAQVDNLMNITWVLIFYSSGIYAGVIYYFTF